MIDQDAIDFNNESTNQCSTRKSSIEHILKKVQKCNSKFKPRMAVSHRSNKNNFDDLLLSMSRDKIILQIVEDEDFSKFKSYFEFFFFKTLQDKLKLLNNTLTNDKLDVILKNIQTIKLKDLNEANINKFKNGKKKKNFFKFLNCYEILNVFRTNNNSRNIKNDNQISLILPKFIDDLVNMITNLINKFSCLAEKEKPHQNSLGNIEFLQELYFSKIFNLYNIKNFEKILKEEVENFSEYFNINKILKKQKFQIQKETEFINHLEKENIENICINCKLEIRNVIYYPCLHFVLCNKCEEKLNYLECPICDEEIKETKTIS